MSDIPYKLVGFADPGGVSLGFVVPLFIGRQSNSPLVQIPGEDEVVVGFEPYGVPDAVIQPAPDIEVREGQPVLYAFAFGKGDVEATTRGRPEPFADRLDDPVLAERPMLAMELADFLDLRAERCRFAALAHEGMRRASDETADHWRDLSVLTVELRRELARRPLRSATRLSQVVVARVKGGVMEIAGFGDRPSPDQFAVVEEAALTALDNLSPLYRVPERGWEVKLRWPKSEEPEPRYEAALLLASSSALNRGTRGNWPQPPYVKVFTSDGPEFAREVEERETPIFVAFDSDEPEQMRRAAGDWTVREMHGIGIAPPRKLPVAHQSQHWRATHVQGASINGGGSQADRGVFAGMRLAIVAELERRARDITWRPKNALLLRARGIGTDPNADAWAALYDRAWSLGVDPSNSLLLNGVKGYLASSRHPAGWAQDALFEDGRRLGGEVLRQVMEETRTSAAIVVDTTSVSEVDGERYRRPVVRLLQSNGWHIENSDDGEVFIYGADRRVALAFDARGGVERVPSAKLDVSGIDLGFIDSAVVTSVASPAAVFDRLALTGQLAVNVRDLVNLDPRKSTVFSILGAQLRRLVTGLPSRSRTRFLGLLVNQALQRHNSYVADTRPLLEAVDLQRPAGLFELWVSTVRQDEDVTHAELRVSERSDTWRPGSSNVFRYMLSVAPDGVAVADL